jgi:hypothetical protein
MVGVAGDVGVEAAEAVAGGATLSVDAVGGVVGRAFGKAALGPVAAIAAVASATSRPSNKP